MRIVLASRSPQRLELLTQAGYRVQAIAPNIVEPPADTFPTPESYVLATACLKAMTVRDQVSSGLIVAADTVAVVQDAVLGKPADRQDAGRMLRRLSGSSHRVVSGLILCKMPEELFVGVVEPTKLRMRLLSEDEIAAYLESSQWSEKAGAYAIRGADDPWIEDRQGSLSNVIGFPLERFEQLLQQLPFLSGDSE